MTSLLGAADRGRPLADLDAFLAERAANEVPNTVTTLLNNVTARAGKVRDLTQLGLQTAVDKGAVRQLAKLRNSAVHAGKLVAAQSADCALGIAQRMVRALSGRAAPVLTRAKRVEPQYCPT